MNKALRLLTIQSLVLCTIGAWAGDKRPVAVFSKTSLAYNESIEFYADHQYDQTITIKAKRPLFTNTALSSYKITRHDIWRLLNVPKFAKLTATLPPKALVELKSAIVPLPMGETSVQCGNGNPQIAVSDLTFPKVQPK